MNVLFLVSLLAACANEVPKKTGAQVQKPVEAKMGLTKEQADEVAKFKLNLVHYCFVRNAIKFDDKVSDASTVAVVVSENCKVEYRKYVDAFCESVSIEHKEVSVGNCLTVYEIEKKRKEMALSVVLFNRTKKQAKPAANKAM